VPSAATRKHSESAGPAPSRRAVAQVYKMRLSLRYASRTVSTVASGGGRA